MYLREIREALLTPHGTKLGAWSKKGDFLGQVARLGDEAGGKAGGHTYLSAGRGSGERGVNFTLHSFPDGYRVLVEEWGRGEGEDRELWLAPMLEEEESYIGLLSEEEARELFPYLFAALELPHVIEMG
jgi:hypothetical protein